MKQDKLKKVTPFGNSGHINVSKDSIGKYYKLVETSPLQEILTKKEVNFIYSKIDSKLKKTTNGYLHGLYRKMLQTYKEDLLSLEHESDIVNLISFLNECGKEGKSIANKIECDCDL